MSARIRSTRSGLCKNCNASTFSASLSTGTAVSVDAFVLADGRDPGFRDLEDLHQMDLGALFGQGERLGHRPQSVAERERTAS